MDSHIVASEQETEQIKTWLAEVNKTSEPELLYCASRDGWNASDFHSKCNNKGATITVVKTSEGYVFGGYADQSWASSGSWKSSNEAFLFSLKCHGGLGPTKMKLKSGQSAYATYNYSDYGPAFGRGDDICIGANGNSLKTGCANIGYSYELPSGASNNYFLTDNSSFNVAEVEVFKV